MPSNLELAVISEDIYHDKSKLGGVWKRKTGTIFKESSGFFWGEYVNEQTKKKVVAFRGTEPSDWSDIVADVHIVLKKSNIQFIKALQQGSAYGSNAVYTGHSLGGALAKFVAASLGYQAIAFNAPGIKGLNNLTAMHKNAKIHNINAVFDPVSKYGDGFGTVETVHVGSIPLIPDTAEPIAVGASVFATRGLAATAVGGYYLVGQHSISNLVVELQSRENLTAANMPYYNLPRVQETS